MESARCNAQSARRAVCTDRGHDAHSNWSVDPARHRRRVRCDWPRNRRRLAWWILLVIAGVCGAIGRGIGGGSRGGVLVSIAVGFIGALFGSMIAAHFHLPELLMVSVEGRGFPILWSIIGAALFVAVVHLISGGGRRLRYD
jgi:uncharacterized membrane protein YeaQ/YmgE (transglycosylase-associated protein family)